MSWYPNCCGRCCVGYRLPFTFFATIPPIGVQTDAQVAGVYQLDYVGNDPYPLTWRGQRRVSCSTIVGTPPFYPYGGPGPSGDFTPALYCGGTGLSLFGFGLMNADVAGAYCWAMNPPGTSFTMDCATMTGSAPIYIGNPSGSLIEATPANCCGLVGPFSYVYTVHITPEAPP